jgi:hypothetical protein
MSTPVMKMYTTQAANYFAAELKEHFDTSPPKHYHYLTRTILCHDTHGQDTEIPYNHSHTHTLNPQPATPSPYQSNQPPQNLELHQLPVRLYEPIPKNSPRSPKECLQRLESAPPDSIHPNAHRNRTVRPSHCMQREYISDRST